MAQERPVPEVQKATEYLANERTFLAWIRTSIAVMSLGFIVARFGLWLREIAGDVRTPIAVRYPSASLPVGEALVVLGGALALLAAWRYHVVNRANEQGRVKADRALIVLVTISVAVIAVAMAVSLFLTAHP